MMWEKPSQCDRRQKCLTPAQLSCLCTYGDAVHRSNYGAFAGQVTGVDGEIKSIKKAQFKTIFSVFTPWGLQPNTKVIQKINVDHPGINPRARQSQTVEGPSDFMTHLHILHGEKQEDVMRTSSLYRHSLLQRADHLRHHSGPLTSFITSSPLIHFSVLLTPISSSLRWFHFPSLLLAQFNFPLYRINIRRTLPASSYREIWTQDFSHFLSVVHIML